MEQGRQGSVWGRRERCSGDAGTRQDKASPGDCAEIRASYARISKSQKWLSFSLQGILMFTVNMAGPCGIACGLNPKYSYLWPGQTALFYSCWDSSWTVLTHNCWLPLPKSNHAFKGSHTVDKESPVNEDLTTSNQHAWFTSGLLREEIQKPEILKIFEAQLRMYVCKKHQNS